MSVAFSFFKKEIIEIIRTRRIFVMPVIYLFFGFMSPLTARYMKEIFKSIGSGGMGGIEIRMPDPTYLDAYIQLFKNMNQICIIILILSVMGTVVDEKIRGTAVPVLTKNLSRTGFILCKFLAGIIFFTFSYLLAVAACIYYTYLLFPRFSNSGLFWALFVLWAYGLLIYTITLFASIISKTTVISAVLSFMGFALLSAGAAIPAFKGYFPGILGGISTGIITGSASPGDAAAPLAIAVGLVAALLSVGIMIFKKQEL